MEVVLACTILALLVFSVQTLFLGLLRNTRQVEARQEAVAALDVLCDYYRERIRQSWSNQAKPGFAWQGEFQGYLYSVRELEVGLVPNPFDRRGTPLKLRLFEVELEFEDVDANGQTVKRTQKAVLSAPR